MPTGIHRSTSRVSLVWVFAAVTALLMVTVAGYAFVRSRPTPRSAVPVFAEGTSSPAAWRSRINWRAVSRRVFASVAPFAAMAHRGGP